MASQSPVSEFLQIVRTIYGSALQTALLRRIPYVIPDHTTLNEKFGVGAGVAPAVTPGIVAIVIGNGGHEVKAGSDGVPYESPIRHRASDAALYSHLPWVLRPEGDDLTDVERLAYGLRAKVVYNNQNYIAYYAKLTTDTVASKIINLLHTVVTNGDEVTKPFIPDETNLSPKPPVTSPTEPTTTNGDYLSVSNVIEMLFETKDVTELVNVAKIMYNNPLRATISEVGIVTGNVQAFTGPGTGTENVNYQEIMGAQIASHVTTYYPVGYANRGFELEIEMGATEPMMGEGAINATSSITPVTTNN